LIQFKGDRFSLGGNLETNSMNFTLHTIQMKKGDEIYLFSDGITDQFGGSQNKKLKSTGLHVFLQELGGQNMKEKGRAFERFYQDWKGENMQVDDIIVIGIKL
jgi:serine phosphatase RsbU (regulator of sigma subunit)